ncbi:cell wall-binding repeat-containing protein [Herbiconiux sp. CPCC 203407]|uniref:Cell wall-binding repeat-containing protein n=1 Tax=Herbiconiux oxytropis TaxID=2970915 RepID=A0AA42BVS5_9MICO|nr:cell wall-binding repeat-containing protein [Herbiconiux oxytropis]MCS5723027.1 cell wall-binding repeat-containing protein [Herbiconiux oxytropis]MCS5726904.1 cell wall-binding repeat-containing protein [Herbiconiux oxytropis]
MNGPSNLRARSRVIIRAVASVSAGALLAVAGSVAAGATTSAPASAAPVTGPAADGVYLGTPWVKPGEQFSVHFVGDSGCGQVQSAEFVESDSGIVTPLAMAGFSEYYWVVRDFAFREPSSWNPLPTGSTGAVTGQVRLTCTDEGAGAGAPTSIVDLPLVVSPTQPATPYRTPTTWTWYSQSPIAAGVAVTVNALGFRPGEAVTATVVNQTKFDVASSFSGGVAVPISATADGEGAVTAQVVLPSGWATTDSLGIIVAGASSRYLLDAASGDPFNGDPSLTLSSNGLAVPGGTVPVRGGGYAAGETVAVALHSANARAAKIATLKADAAGRISGDVAIPAGTAPGSYRLWAGATALSYHLLNTPIVIGTTARISAPDRYTNAVAIAKAAYPGTAPVVYVATGTNYPDALGAGAAAANAEGPLLLTTPADLPAAVRQEILRLKPSKIVVVGGPNSVSEAVYAQLRTLAPAIERRGGADRYEASRSIVAGEFEQAGRAFIATGATFPDALSATSAAASQDAPVILIPGAKTSVDAQTLALLDRLGVRSITITGGPNSVSPAIESQLRAKYGASAVTRLGGADRYEASVNINREYFGSASEAFVAVGVKFPDALAGGVLAATKSAPLVVVRGDCVPAGTLGALSTWGVQKVTLLGGTASLTPQVAALRACA